MRDSRRATLSIRSLDDATHSQHASEQPRAGEGVSSGDVGTTGGGRGRRRGEGPVAGVGAGAAGWRGDDRAGIIKY